MNNFLQKNLQINKAKKDAKYHCTGIRWTLVCFIQRLFSVFIKKNWTKSPKNNSFILRDLNGKWKCGNWKKKKIQAGHIPWRLTGIYLKKLLEFWCSLNKHNNIGSHIFFCHKKNCANYYKFKRLFTEPQKTRMLNKSIEYIPDDLQKKLPLIKWMMVSPFCLQITSGFYGFFLDIWITG